MITEQIQKENKGGERVWFIKEGKSNFVMRKHHGSKKFHRRLFFLTFKKRYIVVRSCKICALHEALHAPLLKKKISSGSG